MPFPWNTVIQWILPSIPEIISTVRNMKKEQQSARTHAPHEDVIGQIEKLEKAMELQSQINEQLTAQLQKLQRTLHIVTIVAIFAAIIAMMALGVIAFR